MTPTEYQTLYDCVRRALDTHAPQIAIDKKSAIATDAVMLAKRKFEKREDRE